MYKVIKINESWSFIPKNDVLVEIMQKLSVLIPGYRFMPSFRCGAFDGKKKFYNVIDYLGETGLLIMNGLVEYAMYDYDYEYDNEYESISIEEIDAFLNTLNLPFKPYDYQIEAFKDSLSKRKHISLMATGSGKSLTITMLIKYFLERDKRVVLILPNINLLKQFEADIKSYNQDDVLIDVVKGGAGNKLTSIGERLTITTWQTLKNLNDEEFEKVDCCIVDEVHGAKAEVLEKILNLCTRAEYKLGFTGTLPNEFIEKLSIMGSVGTHKEYITAKGLIDDGQGSEINIKILEMNYNTDDKVIANNFKDFKSEEDFVFSHTKRNKAICKLSNGLRKRGNTLVLYKYNAHGEDLYKEITGVELTKELKKDFEEQKKYKTFYISGSVSGEQRELVRNYLEENDEYILVANYAILSTGVNIKNLHNMVFAASSKSNVRVRQSIGRGIRKHHNKTIFTVIDVVDNLKLRKENHLLKHFSKRLEIYHKAGFKISKINYNL